MALKQDKFTKKKTFRTGAIKQIGLDNGDILTSSRMNMNGASYAVTALHQISREMEFDRIVDHLYRY
jgi:hypothetical protein